MAHNPLVISCEHAGNEVPPEWRSLFRGKDRLLASHRGWDPGALEAAQSFVRVMGVHQLHSNPTTRLLADPNRSEHNPAIWSEVTRGLPPESKERILGEYWRPWRIEVQAAVEEEIERSGWVFHLSVHTFTPVLKGVRRTMDVGFLYDPRNRNDVEFCKSWRGVLHELEPSLTVRMNAPYRGVSDGVVSAFRKNFGQRRYLGVELEINQRFLKKSEKEWQRLRESLATSFQQVYTDFNKNHKSPNTVVSPRAKVR